MFLPRAVLVAGVEEAIERMKGGSGSPLHCTYISGTSPKKPAELPLASHESCAFRQCAPGELEIRYSSDVARYLLVCCSYDDGWRGTVDGGVVPLFRANGCMLASKPSPTPYPSISAGPANPEVLPRTMSLGGGNWPLRNPGGLGRSVSSGCNVSFHAPCIPAHNRSQSRPSIWLDAGGMAESLPAPIGAVFPDRSAGGGPAPLGSDLDAGDRLRVPVPGFPAGWLLDRSRGVRWLWK